MSALANNFKKNFAGLLRGLLRKVDNDDAEQQSTQRNLLRQPAPSPVSHPAENSGAMAAAMHSASYPTPAAPSRAVTPNISELEMPLMPILEKLPAELQAKSMHAGMNMQQATIAVSVKKVLPQLALGAVKITFGELRNAAPNLFQVGEEYDSLPVILPLNEVLARLSPAMMARNPGQRTVSAPGADIAEVFGPGGLGGASGAAPAKPATTHFKKAAPSEPIKMPSTPPVAGQPLPFAPRATTPAAPPVPAPFAPRATTPANPPVPAPFTRATTPPAPPSAPVPPPAAPQPIPFTPRATTPPNPPVPAPFARATTPPAPPSAPVPPPATPQPLPFAPRATTPSNPPVPPPFARTTPTPTPSTPPPTAPQPLPFTARTTTPTPTPHNFNGGNGNGGNGGNGGGLQTPPPPTRGNNIPSLPNPISGGNGIPNSIPSIPMSKPTPPAPTPAPRPMPAPAARPAPEPVQEAPSILAPLAALAEAWPEALQMEIANLDLTEARVALPIHLIEPALKRGRVIFSWHHVRSWIKPTPPASPNDGTELELPLKVIAPLFLAPKIQQGRTQGKTEVPPSDVPNLFFGFPQPQPEEMAPPVNMPDAAPRVKPLDEKATDSNFYVWGEGAENARQDETELKPAVAPATDFTNRRTMPKEIIDRAMKLPGVTGAIIALPDGLKVACQLPQELNADTVAAFLPQLFSRVGQCAKELRMGELNNLNFTLGNVPWKIFRVNAVYFAAFGVAGVSLPTPQLAMLAAELDRKK